MLTVVQTNTMNRSTVEEILLLIEQAEQAREMALRERNQQDFGYPFVAGYTTSTLVRIREILSKVEE